MADAESKRTPYPEEMSMASGWTAANPTAEATDAIAQATLRTGYVPADTPDVFHVRVAAGMLIRELEVLGFQVVRVDRVGADAKHCDPLPRAETARASNLC
jgi:hypothetical protein